MRRVVVPALVALSVTPGRAEDVAILKTRVAPYAAAAKGAVAKLGGVSVLSIDLADKVDGQALGASLSRAKVRVVLAIGRHATLAARELRELPVVTCMVLDPADAAVNPAIPGVHLKVPALAQLGMLRDLTGGGAKVAVLYDPAHSDATIRDAESAAKTLGCEILRLPVADVKDVFPALRAIKKQGGDALWMIPDPTVYNKDSMDGILRYTIENRIPFMAADKEGVRQGALCALSPEFEKVGAQAAEMVAGILGGKSPAALPLEAPRELGLYVNEKTAALLDLKLNESVLKSAVESFK
ncbi:MAG: ABC transporter substrate-binding protein [Acidobacteriota bacterium]